MAGARPAGAAGARGEGRVCAPDCAPRPSTECRPILRTGSTGSGPQNFRRSGLARWGKLLCEEIGICRNELSYNLIDQASMANVLMCLQKR